MQRSGRQFGERYKINDPATGKPATRNVFFDEPSPARGATVKALQARGAFYWQCNVAFGNAVQQLANETKTPAAELRAELLAAFNPGVMLVPSHTMAVGLVQERGFTYDKV